MYYVWDAEIRVWQRRIVQLDLDWTDGLLPFANTCEIIRDRLPPVLDYRLIPMRAPLLDVMWSGSTFDLYSPAVRRLLSDLGTAFEQVSAVIRGSARRVLTSEYAFVHVTTCAAAVDWDRSDLDIGTNQSGGRSIRRIRHLVLNQGAIPANTPVFRLAEWSAIVLVNEEFRAEWVRRGLTGADFRTLDHYPRP
jgi:hypothetical protein